MNRIDLIKALLPGFLPILVYILAEGLFGERIGLATAIGFGLLELVFGYLKEKRIDTFILLDVALITALGLVSILLDTAIFFKLKPAVIELILVAVFLYSMGSRTNILGMMMARYSRNAIPLPSNSQMRKMILPLVVILSVHALLTIFAAFWSSKEVWAFISGGLFYIFFLAYILIRLLAARARRRNWRKRYADDEWFDILDENGRILFQAPRTVCHGNPDLLHPVVHLHLFDHSNRLFLQKRAASKKIQPDKWDTAVGGHLSSGESVADALKRECLEELGLDADRLSVRPLARYIWRNSLESEMVFSFHGHSSLKPRPNPEEISEGRFWTARQIREKMDSGLFSENFRHEFKSFLEPLFDHPIPHR